MEYFLMLQDKRIPNPLTVSMSERELMSGEPVVAHADTDNQTVVVDLIVKRILFNSYFILSDELMKVFKMYDERLGFVPIFITNDSHSLQKVYWRLDMEQTEGVVTNKFLEPVHMCLRERALKENPVHKVHYEKQVYIVVNRCVAESILRRLPIGITLQKIRTEKESEQNAAHVV